MSRVLHALRRPDLVRKSLDRMLVERRKDHDALTRQKDEIEASIAEVDKKLGHLRKMALAGAFTPDEVRAEREDLDQERGRLDTELADTDCRLQASSYLEDQQLADLVLEVLTQPGFQDIAGLEWYTLATLFPNRLAHAAQKISTNRAAVDLYKVAAAIPSPEPDPAIAAQFLKLAQELVKRVTVDNEGKIRDFILGVKIQPPIVKLKGSLDELHTLNRKCTMSHFQHARGFCISLPPAPMMG